MNVFNKLSYQKIVPVFANGAYLLLPGLINQVLAFFVIALNSSSTWGSMVQLQLYYYLATAVTAWGNKDFLLVQFSKQQSSVTSVWQQSFLNRFTLLLPVIGLTFFIYPLAVAIHLCCWILFRYFAQSVESIATYEKKYKKVLLSELASWLPLGLLFFYKNALSTEQVLLILTLIHFCRALVLTFGYAGLLKGLLHQVMKPGQLFVAAPFMLLSLAGFLQSKSDLYCISLMAGKETIGRYQVLMSYVSLALLVPGFLITPYITDVYTMEGSAFCWFKKRFIGAGIVIGLAATGITAVVLRYLYRLEFGPVTYLLASCYVLFPYFFLFTIYRLYKSGRQLLVMLISFAGILVNIISCILLVPLWGIEGALFANCISSAFLFVCYRSAFMIPENNFIFKRYHLLLRQKKANRLYALLGVTNCLCFDGGANIGKRSSMLLKRDCRVIAIEPQPECIKALQKIAAANTLLHVDPRAISNQDEKATLFISNISEVSTLSQQFIDYYSYQSELKWDEQVTIDATSLDNLITVYGLPHYCKLDLEGYELHALTGLSIAIAIISFEINRPFTEDAVACIRLLAKLGNYRFTISYYEQFRFETKWIDEEEIILFCRELPSHVLTGEIFARLEKYD